MKESIARLVRDHGQGRRLLEVGGETGWHTVAYAAQLGADHEATIYD